MNIFKVLASGRKSFQEETASAVLLWLLNPNMDHGLGFSFLSKFIDRLSNSGIKELKQESENFKAYFRGDDNPISNMKFNLEYYVDGAFIDIVLFMDNWVIAIENKIYLKSFTKRQLQNQYDGLIKNLKSQKDENETLTVLMLYLVPSKGKIAPDLEKEFNNLKTKKRKNNSSDLKQLVTWQKSEREDIPSISSIIDEILDEETRGIIDPIPTYTRDTLRALKVFITNNFEGYYYDNASSSGGLNPATEDELNIESIRKDSKKSDFVGVKGGISGLLKLSTEKLTENTFQCTSQDMSNERWWMNKELFLNIVDWRLGKKVDAIEWPDLKLDSLQIYHISKDFPDIHIGIQGGVNGLEKLDPEAIRGKSWQISMKKKNSQWISASDFKRIIDKKQVF